MTTEYKCAKSRGNITYSFTTLFKKLTNSLWFNSTIKQKHNHNITLKVYLIPYLRGLRVSILRYILFVLFKNRCRLLILIWVEQPKDPKLMNNVRWILRMFPGPGLPYNILWIFKYFYPIMHCFISFDILWRKIFNYGFIRDGLKEAAKKNIFLIAVRLRPCITHSRA